MSILGTNLQNLIYGMKRMGLGDQLTSVPPCLRGEILLSQLAAPDIISPIRR